MRISKILNNNAVISKDKNNNEIVVMGKGLAFKKRVDDFLDDNQIEKTYIFSPENTKEIIKLFSSIPDVYIEITSNIISLAETTLNKNLSKNLYISLTDHIYSAVSRFEEGISFTNPLLWDIKRFYINEYEVALEALNIINEKINIELPEDEAGFIALHIVNSQLEQNENAVYEITNIMQEILKIVRLHFGIDFDEDSINYYRFITHLKFFAQRILNKNAYEDDKVDDLYLIIKNNYPESYSAVEKIREFIKSKYKYTLNNEEELYLTIHIEKVVNKK
ncbi:BglG family transcription antiterminator LicT [Miniphocaeibacter halophilus]|uniref:PRD domain-containing protein n=1 Tax=Miniphocaeibacter halophilus TaxID=2931922 RepID=A0AC61N069_9FIRM|nr:PRD domain-containing protein [Miniphocaeibacter halophilus]QQK08731.1 PRD domain-containing protein [Miniphocaeibacter halophilus]